MTHHLMLDLETRSSRPDASISQIALYAFDPWGTEGPAPDPTRLFLRNVSPQAFAHVSRETLEWWSQQSEEARDGLRNPEPVGLNPVLRDLREFIQLYSTKHSDPLVWSHATFDPPILAFAHQARDLSLPYPFRNNVDLRTMQRVANVRYDDVHDGPKIHEHEAAWDAWFQARVAQLCVARLGLERDSL